MDRSLLRLIGLHYKSLGRRTFRGVRSWRGALLLVFTLGFFAVTIGPQLFVAFTMGDRPEMRKIAGVFEPLAPLYLFGFTMLFVFTSAGETAVAFTPSEVDFLFAGPFARRELLIYKLTKTGLAILPVSAFITMMTLVNLRWWLAGFVGIAMALAMVQLVGMIVSLGGQILGEVAYSRARKVGLVVLVVVGALAASQVVGRMQGGATSKLLSAFQESPALQVMVAPFQVYTRAALAGRLFPDLIGWGAAALAIDAVLVGIVLRLDRDYLETAATISQRVYERVVRMKQGGGFAMPVGKAAARVRVSGLPWMGGFGPIAWRQISIALRTSRGVLVSSVLVIVMIGGSLAFSSGSGPAGPKGSALPWVALGMVFYLTFLFSMQLPWAFRGDLDHIETLKTLPITPVAIAAGELAGGTLILCGIQIAALALAGAFAPSGWPILASASAFCPPFDVLILALNNLLFLLYPVRLAAGTAFDFQMFGRMMLSFALLFLMLIPALGVPAAIGGVAYLVSGYSTMAFAVTAWLVLAIELVPLVLALAWAFWRFDVSTQIPA